MPKKTSPMPTKSSHLDTPPQPVQEPKRLYRSEEDKIIAGVAGGISNYFDLDPALVRITFILLNFLGWSGVIIYLILWLILPTKSEVETESDELIKQNVADMKQKAESVAQDARAYAKSPRSRSTFGLLLIILGGILLLENFGFGRFIDFGKLWPLILVLIGLGILTK